MRESTTERPGSSGSYEASIRETLEGGIGPAAASEARHIIAIGRLQIGEMVYEQGDDACAAELLRESVAFATTNRFDVMEWAMGSDALAALRRTVANKAAAAEQFTLERGDGVASLFLASHLSGARAMSRLCGGTEGAWRGKVRNCVGRGQAMTQEEAIAYALEDVEFEYAYSMLSRIHGLFSCRTDAAPCRDLTRPSHVRKSARFSTN